MAKLSNDLDVNEAIENHLKDSNEIIRFFFAQQTKDVSEIMDRIRATILDGSVQSDRPSINKTLRELD